MTDFVVLKGKKKKEKKKSHAKQQLQKISFNRNLFVISKDGKCISCFYSECAVYGGRTLLDYFLQPYFNSQIIPSPVGSQKRL